MAKAKQAKGAKQLRILAAGDFHGDTGLAQRLAQKAVDEKVDLVVLCGDLTLGELSTEGLIGPFVKAKKKVLLVPGNHETIATADFLAKRYAIENIHGNGIKIGSTGIFGCGSANIGLFQLQEGEIYDLLKAGFEKVKDAKKKIMISHVHPAKTLMGRLGIFPGSAGVRQAIARLKPNIALCSHVHEAAGIEEHIGRTKVINVGRQGKILEV